MSTMAEFKISTNIERDAELELDYIVTKNSNEVYDRIIYNYSRGQNSFSIIGSYGTGKSTFLWAFENHLNGNDFDFKIIVTALIFSYLAAYLAIAVMLRFLNSFGFLPYIVYRILLGTGLILWAIT